MVRTKIDKNEFINIVQKYKSGISLCELERQYPTDRRTLKKILSEYGVELRDHSHKSRKYTLDENFFDNINTQNKAYILGLLFADGCNYPPTNTVTISLQERDKNVLDKINCAMGSNRPLYFKDLHSKNPNWQNSYILTIANKHMSSQLVKLGMVQNKSLILKFPNYLPDNLVRHFIRGYFDGDGHIEWKNSFHFLTIASTKEFCEHLKDLSQNLLNTYSNILPTANKESNTKIFNICGMEKSYKFLKYMYDDCELYLERKYEQYKLIENQMNKSLIA